jgi:cysteine desulfurase
MHVNNELGTVNSVEEIGEVCAESEVLFHSDAAQSLGKVDIDVDDLNVDLMSFSAHKIGGPKGIGALYIRDLRKRDLVPVIHGSGQEQDLRGGTIPAPLIIGFEKAVKHFPAYYNEFCKLGIKAHLIELLEQRQIPYQINGFESALESCISLTLPETNEHLLVNKYKDEVCLSQGSACSSKAIEPSHVLSAIGLSRAQADKTFRVSFPLNITKEEISRVVSIIEKSKT